jgi:cyanophycinase-like exopeptidase
LPEHTPIGPQSGSLLAVGGGRLEETGILQRFVAMAGGLGARITIIPTAGEGDFTGPYTSYTEDFMKVGATNLEVLHLRNVCIDQHHLVRNRHFDMLQVIQAHPELLGIGIDESTAIVVRGNELEVIGKSYVAVYDPTKRLGDSGTFFFLRSGDRYDLAKREVIEASPPSRGFNKLGAHPTK